MLAPIAAIGLAGLVAAAPATTTASTTSTGPYYPPTENAQAFKLVLNVTDPSRDLDPPVHGTYVTSIHVGPAYNYVGQTAADGRVFYVNGTAHEVRYGDANVISDGGTPPFPEALSLVPDEGSETLSTAWLNAGAGQRGIGITGFPNPVPQLYPYTYVACRQALAYYGGREFVVVKNARTTVGEDGRVEYNIPEGCAPLSLLPQCAELNELPAGSLSSHEYAAEVRCYKDISSIDWPEYHAF